MSYPEPDTQFDKIKHSANTALLISVINMIILFGLLYKVG